MTNKERIEILERMTAEPDEGQEARLDADELDAVLYSIDVLKTITKGHNNMQTNPEGEIVLTETEKQIILEGARLLSLYCESLDGCAACPFMRERLIDDAHNPVRTCECKEYLPCCWTIPETWSTEGGEND